MTKYELISTHTADAVQYVAPNGQDGVGNVDEVKALCDEITEQADWSPLTGQNALVLGDASLANTDWLLKFDDGSVLILGADEFEASGYTPMAAPADDKSVTPPVLPPVKPATSDAPPAK